MISAFYFIRFLDQWRVCFCCRISFLLSITGVTGKQSRENHKKGQQTMNFHHSGADRGRRFPWFTNGHIKTTKLTFADSEPQTPSHVPTRNRREWRREVGNPRRRRWMPSPTSTRRGRLTTPCWPRAGASSTPDMRCVDAAPETTDAHCPTTRSPRGAHHSNPPPSGAPDDAPRPRARSPLATRAFRRSTSATRGS